MDYSFQPGVSVSQSQLRILAYLPTACLPKLVHPKFWFTLSDADVMRIAVMLAQKSYEEDGCPIGGIVLDNRTRRILGKGHNTLVQENHPYNHGETSAMRDAGSIDFSQTTIFTTLTPCNVCACLIEERGFPRVVIGNSPISEGPISEGQPANNEARLRSRGIQVDLLPDAVGIDLYTQYAMEKPDLNTIDWRGVAALKSTT